jgi:membrane protease YdiL (CAAX protease family)
VRAAVVKKSKIKTSYNGESGGYLPEEVAMSTVKGLKLEKLGYKLGLSTILLIATALFFLGDHLYLQPAGIKIILTAIPPVILLGFSLLFYRNIRLRRYWEVTFALCCGTFGLFLAWAPGSWPERILGVSANTAQGIAILKFFELLPVALAIILLTRIVQGNLVPIYLQKGNLKIGLGLGLILSLILLGGYLLISWSTIDFEKAAQSFAWMMIFSILDAFFEELLIRGLLLRRFTALLGNAWALILSALVYGLFFLGVQSVTGPIPFGALILILPLGLVYSFIMQKSDSIWGSLSLHAAVDLVYLMGIFASV